MTPRVQDASKIGQLAFLESLQCRYGLYSQLIHITIFAVPQTSSERFPRQGIGFYSMQRAADAVLLQRFYDHHIQLLHHVSTRRAISCSPSVAITPRKLAIALLLPPGNSHLGCYYPHKTAPRARAPVPTSRRSSTNHGRDACGPGQAFDWMALITRYVFGGGQQ